MVATTKEKPRPWADIRSPEIERIAQNESGARLVAKVLRQLLGKRTFADPMTLKDALEAHCHELGMRCDRVLMERALDLVGSNKQLFTAAQKTKTRPPTQPSVPPVTHTQAKAVLDALDVDVSGGNVRRRPSRRSRLVPA